MVGDNGRIIVSQSLKVSPSEGSAGWQPRRANPVKRDWSGLAPTVFGIPGIGAALRSTSQHFVFFCQWSAFDGRIIVGGWFPGKGRKIDFL